MKNKAIFKFNNGELALLCSKCNGIIKTGKDFTEEEHLACKDEKYLKWQLCDRCKELNNEL